MSSLEKEARYERRKGSIQRALLGAVAVSGLLLWTIAAPNTLRLLKYVPKNKYRLDGSVRSAASRLVDRGLVKFSTKNGKKYLELTSAGIKAAQLEALKEALREKSRKRWDKRWRMVIFDIPERRRRTRDTLRNTLRSCGFLQLQASVWVFPYDCEEIITLIKADLKVGRDILYTIVEKIEYDDPIRRHFDLS